MEALKNIITPTSLFLVIIAAGYFIGKIKIFNIGLGISAVLIVAIAAGLVISKLCPFIADESFDNAMNIYSKTGTAIFVSSIGISSGAYLKKGQPLKNILCFSVGAVMVLTGFLATKVIGFIDVDFDSSTLLGILCGALTSTPGLSAVCEKQAVVEENAILGYGAAYLFGVIGVVLFVQCFSKSSNESIKISEQSHYKKGGELKGFAVIAITGVVGQCIGLIHLPIVSVSLGTTGGILICGIIVGYILNKISKLKAIAYADIGVYRTLGLVMFFVGTGVKAGQSLDIALDIKWFVYGAIITVCSIITGDMLGKLLLHMKKKSRMFIIAGGMTSTPALGVLVKKGNEKEDMAAYSLSYLGALMTIAIVISFM